MKRFALLFFFFLAFFGSALAQEFPRGYIPRNVDEAIFYLTFTWSKDEQMAFKLKPEDKAVAEQHFFAGLDIRNRWYLFAASPLANYFKWQGVEQPEDMTAIILRSFHRNLNRKEIALEEQFEYHREYWQFLNKRYSEKEKSIARNFNSIQVGDTVEMAFPVMAEATGQTMIQLLPAPEKTASAGPASPACKLKGVVLKKDHHEKTYKLFIKLTDVCAQEAVYYGPEKLAIGHILNFDLSQFNWQKVSPFSTPIPRDLPRN